MDIKVLYIIDHLKYGGAQNVVKSFAEKVRSPEINPIICSLRHNPPAIQLKVEHIGLNYSKYNFFSAFKLAKICQQKKIDIMHSNLQKSIITSLLASFFCRSKVVIHEHGDIFFEGVGFAYRWLLKLLGKRSSAAIVNSIATKNALLKTKSFNEEDIHVISNFIDVSRFNPANHKKEKIKRELGIQDKTVIGFLGRLDFCKGIDLIIKAFGKLKDDKFVLLIVGDGQEMATLKKITASLALEDKVIFTGLSKKPAEYIATFDIGVMPSRREGFGLSAIEIMAMRVPLVASAVGGLKELVKTDYNGISLEELSPECICKAIRKLTDNEQLRNDCAQNAYDFSRQFDGQKQIEQVKAIYKSILKV